MDSSIKFWKKYQRIFTFFVILLALFATAFFRYGIKEHFPAPQVLLDDFQQGFYEVTPSGSFVVPFSMKMKKASVEDALTIHPQETFDMHWEKNNLYIKTRNKLEPGDIYRIFLAQDAKSIWGKYLMKDYELVYKVGGQPKILNIFPSDKNLSETDHISILFSHPMKTERSEGNFGTEFLRLTPQPAGEWKWYNSKTLAFHPTNRFTRSTQYHLENIAPLQTRDGGILAEKIDKTFETKRIALIPEERKTPLGVQDSFALRFNTAVGLEALKKNLKLYDSLGAEGSYTLAEGEEHSYTIKPKSQWLYNEAYTIHLAKGLLPKEGNLGLEEDIELTFETEPVFIFSGQDESKDIYISADNSITFQLSKEIPNLENSLSVLPKMNFEIKKENENYTLVFPEYSQKRENIKMYLSETVNSEKIKIINRPLEFSLLSPKPLQTSIKESSEKVCFLANNPLTKRSFIQFDHPDLRRRFMLSRSEQPRSDEDECPLDEEMEYLYVLDKAQFIPNESLSFTAQLTDLYQQTVSLEGEIETNTISSADVGISSEFPLFYFHTSNQNELVYHYQTKNLKRINASICKLTAQKTIEIETSYERRWFSFQEDASKCLDFVSWTKELEPNWGKWQKQRIDLSEHFDDLDTGLYYIHVLAPGLTNEEGEAIESNGVIQYSHWNMLSKRGDSSLVWLIDSQNNTPINKAAINYYSNDGILLEALTTNDQGLAIIDKNLLKYDFVLAKKGVEELLLNVFYKEGLEPERFGVPSNIQEDNYVYQFYLENPNSATEEVEGVFILKEKIDDNLQKPNIKEAVVALYDQEERLLWRGFEQFDDWGNLHFQILPHQNLLDGKYQVSICVGLHQGVCYGEHFWTSFTKGQASEQYEDKAVQAKDYPSSTHLIDLGNVQVADVGETIRVRLSPLKKSLPTLFTVERDGIEIVQTFIPESEEEFISFQVTPSMIPKTILTLTQFDGNTLIYDAKELSINVDRKELTSSSETFPNMSFRDYFDNPIENEMWFSFLLNKPQSFLNNQVFLENLYPYKGTSVISAASISTLEDKLIPVNGLQTEKKNQTIIIDGKFEGFKSELVGAEINPSNPRFLVVHDQQGNGNSLSIHLQSSEISVEPNIPNFVRDRDKLLMPIYLSNGSDTEKNIRLSFQSPHFEFLNGRNIFSGLPLGKEMVLDVPIVIHAPLSLGKENFEIDVFEKEQPLLSQDWIIPIAQQESSKKMKIFANHHSLDQKGEMEIPLRAAGKWKKRIYIAPSPIAFVMDNFQAFLSQPPYTAVHSIQQLSLYQDFKTLLSDEDDINIKLSSDMILNELRYLEIQQNQDGGWTKDFVEYYSEVEATAEIAKGLSLIINSGGEVSENMKNKLKDYLKGNLDERVTQRIQEEIPLEELNELEAIEELKILNALSSLTPTGVQYANNWFLIKDTLSNEALVLLLLSLEDYRDAGVSGMQFKIEEIIQLLKSRREKIHNKIWLSGSSSSDWIDEFILTSWYLEALIRQASAHSDIPHVINWLIEKKHEQAYQSPRHQYSYLQAMGAYLKIYQENITASEIHIQSGEKNYTYPLDPEKILQVFTSEELLNLDEGDEFLTTLTYTTDTEQALFIEVVMDQYEKMHPEMSEGLSVYHHFPKNHGKQKEELMGEIILLAPQEIHELVVIQPQVSGAHRNTEDIEGAQRISSSDHELRYFFETLPAGETRIPFEWIPEYAGVFQVPPVYAYSNTHPEVFGTSNSLELEIRTK